jgi:hypothetical protein
MSWDDTCGVCGNTVLWWPSKMGFKICMVCCRDPLDALEVLARRASTAAVREVQAWQQASDAAASTSLR